MGNDSLFIKDMSLRTGIQYEQIESIIENSKKEYRIAYIETSGKVRNLYIPSDALKLIQINLIDFYFKKIIVSNCAHGYVKNKSIKTNALSHRNSIYFFQTDISSFFPSINEDMIRRTLKEELPNIKDSELSIIIKIIAPFGHLDLGSPTSPILSNIIMKNTDRIIYQLLIDSSQNQIVYTRYSDDITISSKNTLDINLHLKIKEILNNAGFRMNTKKTRYSTLKENIKITGVFLKLDNSISIGTKYKKKLKHYLFLTREGKGTDLTAKQILGMLAFLKDIEPEYYLNLILKYSENGENIVSILNELIS